MRKLREAKLKNEELKLMALIKEYFDAKERIEANIKDLRGKLSNPREPSGRLGGWGPQGTGGWGP